MRLLLLTADLKMLHFTLVWFVLSDLPDANALVNPAEGLKDEETGILNEVLQASNQEEVIHKNLRDRMQVI